MTRVWGWLLASLMTCALLALPVSGAIALVPEDDSIHLDVAAGIGGTPVAGVWQPVRVTVTADAPRRVTVIVEGRNEGSGAASLRQDVELAAGTTKELWFLVAPNDGLQVGWQDQAGDSESEPISLAARGGPPAGMLGMGDFSQRVGAVTNPYSEQVWEAVEVSDEVLALGPLALQALGTLTTTADALAGLDDDQLDTIMHAVKVQGLHLVVTDVGPGMMELPNAPATIVDGQVEPVPWAHGLGVVDGTLAASTADRTAGASVVAGTGRITFLSETIAADLLEEPEFWGELWTASPEVGGQAWQGEMGFDVWGAQGGRINLPPITAMLGFVGLYLLAVLVVGVFVVRRLRRRELAWVVLPLVAMLFAGAAFAGSVGNQPRIGEVLAGGIWIDGAGTEHAASVVRTINEASIAVVYAGPGWNAVSYSWENAAQVAATPDATRVTQDVRSQEALLTSARRPTSQPPPFELEAAHVSGAIEIELVNTSPGPLTSLRLDAAGRAVEIAELAPGETALVTVPTDDSPVTGDNVTEVFGSWQPAALVDDDQLQERFGEEADFGGVAEPMPMDVAGPGFPGNAVNFLTHELERQVTGQGGLVWVRAVTPSPVFSWPTITDSNSEQIPQAVAVGETPSGQLDEGVVTVAAHEIFRQEERFGSSHFLQFGRLEGGGTSTLRLPVPAGPIESLTVDAPTTGGGCVAFDVVASNGELLETRESCGPDPLCPEDAGSCTMVSSDAVEVCRDEVCVTHVALDGMAEMGALTTDVWDQVAQTWVDVADQDPGGLVPEQFVSPLGEVVLRVQGEAMSLSLDSFKVLVTMADGS